MGFTSTYLNLDHSQGVHLYIFEYRAFTGAPNQKCMYGAALAISGNHWLYFVIFGMTLKPYYFELVIVGFR